MYYDIKTILKGTYQDNNKKWYVEIMKHEELNASCIRPGRNKLEIFITDYYLKDIKSFNSIIKNLLSSFNAGKWNFNEEKFKEYSFYYLTNINFKEVNKEQWFNLLTTGT